MERILNHYHSFLVLGISTLVLGVLAVLSPFQAGLRFEIMVAFIFIGVGLTHALHSFWSRKWGGLFFELFGAVHYLLVGLMLLANPGPGATILILLLAMLFIMQGMVQFGLVSQMCLHKSKNWMLISGLLAVVLGVLTWLQWPNGAYWTIGLFVGIHLLFRGASLLALAISVRQVTHIDRDRIRRKEGPGTSQVNLTDQILGKALELSTDGPIVNEASVASAIESAVQSQSGLREGSNPEEAERPQPVESA